MIELRFCGDYAMNRYALGGAMALLVLLIFSGSEGVGRLLQGNDQRRDEPQTEDGALGTRPIEQAGQAVRRQSQTSQGIPATGTATPVPMGDNFAPTNDGLAAPANTPPILNPAQSGAPSNVIPNQGATTLPAQVGDIAPVQNDLVRPNPVPPSTNDPELESIPALW